VARRSHNPAAETLEEIEGFGDRMVEWVRGHPAVVLGSLLGLLVAAAAVAVGMEWRERSREQAAAALARVEAEYAEAMGAEPGAVEIPEPANPETARQVRERFVGRYAGLAEEYAGRPVGALAALHAGRLQTELGRPEEALEAWRGAVAAFGGDEPVTALLWGRIASLHESQGRWAEAAEAYARAAEVESYPLRHRALGDAARAWAEAGEAERALAAFERLEEQAGAASLPDHVRIRLLELRARQRAG